MAAAPHRRRRHRSARRQPARKVSAVSSAVSGMWQACCVSRASPRGASRQRAAAWCAPSRRKNALKMGQEAF